MSRDRDETDGEIVLPGGMELVVPPAARPTRPVEAADGEPGSNAREPRPQDGAARRPPAA